LLELREKPIALLCKKKAYLIEIVETS